MKNNIFSKMSTLLVLFIMFVVCYHGSASPTIQICFDDQSCMNLCTGCYWECDLLHASGLPTGLKCFYYGGGGDNNCCSVDGTNLHEGYYYWSVVEQDPGIWSCWGDQFLVNNASDIFTYHFTCSGSNCLQSDRKNGTNTPKEFALYQNYPNPFNPSTSISYDIPKDAFVKLDIYNTVGQKVKELVNEYKQFGSYSTNFDAENLPSGIYIYTIRAGNFVKSMKMCLIK